MLNGPIGHAGGGGTDVPYVSVRVRPGPEPGGWEGGAADVVRPVLTSVGKGGCADDWTLRGDTSAGPATLL